MSNTPKIDEILDTYISNYNLEVLGFQQSGQETVKKLLYQLILEVIGEDEPDRRWDHQEQSDLYIMENVHRNKLKVEQRQKLNNLFGKDK